MHTLRFFFILFLTIISSVSQAQPYLDAYQRGQDEFGAANYLTALKHYRKATELVKKRMGRDNDQYAWMVSMQAMTYEMMGQFPEALSLRQEVLKLAVRVFGEQSLQYALSLSALASHYMNTGQDQLSFDTYLKSHERLVKLIDPLNEQVTNSLFMLGIVAYRLERYDDAINYHKKALKIIEQTGERMNLKASMLQSIGQSYAELGQFQRGNKFNELAIEEQVAYEEGQGIVTNGRAAIYADYAAGLIAQRRFSEAESNAKMALAITRQVSGNRSPNYTRILGLLAEVETRLGNYDTSIKWLKEAIEVARSNFSDESLDVYHLVSLLASNYKAKGDYVAAEQWHKWVIEHSNPPYKTSLNNLGVLYHELGNREEALRYYDQLEKVYESGYGKQSSSYALLLHNKATIYDEMGDDRLAIDTQLKANELLKSLEGESSRNHLIGLNNLADRFADTGDLTRAEKHLGDAYRIAKAEYGLEADLFGSISNNYAAFVNQKETEKTLQHYTLVEKYYRESLAAYKASLGTKHPSYLSTAHNLAAILEGKGQVQEAADLFWEVLSTTMNDMDALLLSMSGAERNKYLQTIEHYAQNYRRLCIEEHQGLPKLTKHLVEVQARMKGILFSSSNQVARSLEKAKDTETLKKYEAWKEKNIQLAQYIQAMPEERKRFPIDEETLRRDINELEKNFGSSSTPSIRKKYQARDIARSLRPDEAAIDVFRVVLNTDSQDTIYAALLILKETGDSPQLVIFPNSQLIESQYQERYRNQIRRKQKDFESYNHFWKPLQSYLIGINRIYFSADGVFNGINMETLQDPATDEYVADRHDIVRINNLSYPVEKVKPLSTKLKDLAVIGHPSYDLVQANDQKPSILPAVNLGSNERFLNASGRIQPLEGAKKEVQSIYKMASKRGLEVMLLMDDEATEARAKTLESPDILHIATHGFFLKSTNMRRLRNNLWAQDNIVSLKESPMLRSGLLLAGAEQGLKRQSSSYDDGILTAYEASYMNLTGTRLVVLSACETGLGEVANGEGVYGLQRAFQEAGAQAVLMSLWTVSDDSTEKLMKYFYDALLNGKPAEDAFFAAQDKIKKEFPNPYDWGAFVFSAG